MLAGAQTSEAITEIADGAGEARTVIQLTSKLLDAAGQAQIVSVLTDITERQKAERRLTYIANFDLLTGLPNQGQFRRMLEAEVASAAARDACVGTLVVSLERVQEITDLLGHEAGDGALQADRRGVPVAAAARERRGAHQEQRIRGGGRRRRRAATSSSSMRSNCTSACPARCGWAGASFTWAR